MREKIVLELDQSTNMVYDADGALIGTLVGSSFESVDDKSEVFDRVNELIELGVTAKEIIKMRKAGLL